MSFLKKISLFGCIVAFCTTISMAGNHSSNPGYATIDASYLQFEASQQDNTVVMSRGSFVVPQEQHWKYWKVIRSQSNPNPVYPDDSYIKAIGNISTSTYTDIKAPVGKSYYRVCAITASSTQKYRHCSNVVPLTIQKNNVSDHKNVPDTPKKTPTPTYSTSYSLSSTTQKTLDMIAQKYIQKLQQSDMSAEEKLEKVQTVISLFGAMSKKKTGKAKAMFLYISQILEEKATLMEIQSTLSW